MVRENRGFVNGIDCDTIPGMKDGRIAAKARMIRAIADMAIRRIAFLRKRQRSLRAALGEQHDEKTVDRLRARIQS